MAQDYEGTHEQLVKQFSKLPQTREYKVTVVSAAADATEKQPKLITFGMFPQFQALTEEDSKCAEWREIATDSQSQHDRYFRGK